MKDTIQKDSIAASDGTGGAASSSAGPVAGAAPREETVEQTDPPGQSSDMMMDDFEQRNSRMPRPKGGSLGVSTFVESSEMMYEGLDQRQVQTLEINKVVENLEGDAPGDLVSEAAVYDRRTGDEMNLHLIHISEPTRQAEI